MIHLIVGSTGAGKTTYAHELKKTTQGVVFSIDLWNKILFLPDKKPTDGLEWFLNRIERAERMIMDLIIQLEAANTDSILDLGFSKFEHREKFRSFARDRNYASKIHFLNIPRELRQQRVIQRNQEQGPTYAFEVSQADFDFMEHYFERPSPEELNDGLVIKV
ncbi:AAA family ATPase [Croceiramulus getboli]|nr:ATP-binding protein [Flavobacteriaceae bacterium YJPT1-3]